MPTLYKNVTLSPEEYLEGEKSSDLKHEYEDGRIIAMVGASRAHDRIQINLTLAIGNHLRGTPCQLFSSSMKVHIDNTFYYPDLSVSCSPTDQQEYYLEEPVLVIEILSPPTEQRDRTGKRLTYQTLPSLKEYVLIAQDRMAVEIYRRSQTGWDLELYLENEVVRFKSIDLTLPIGEIYRDVRMGD